MDMAQLKETFQDSLWLPPVHCSCLLFTVYCSLFLLTLPHFSSNCLIITNNIFDISSNAG